MRGVRSRFRIAAFPIAFAISSATIGGLAYALLQWAETKSPSVGIAVMGPIHQNLESIRVQRDRYRVAYLGDSTVVAYPLEHQLPKRLQEATARLGRGRPPIVVAPLAAMGLTPFDFYFLTDVVIETAPDLVVLPFNPAAFSAPWRTRFPRGELAGWLQPEGVVAALSEPLHYIGLTVDRVLLYQLASRLLGFDTWHQLLTQQARLESARLDLELWASSGQRPNPVEIFRRRYWIGSAERLQIPRQKRYNETGMRIHHGGAFDGQDASHPMIRIFRAAIERFEEAGIPVLVYVVPINVEHAGKLGVLNQAGLSATLRAVERSAVEGGAEFVDLHDLLPDAGFSDAPGHFTYEGEFDGPRRVSEALAPSIVERARAGTGSSH